MSGVVVLGVPRSGTTLLRRLIGAHPAFADAPETFLLTAAARFLADEPYANGLDAGVRTGLLSIGYAPEEVVSRLRRFVFDFRREHAARVGKPRWVEKTAFDVFYLREIEELCGVEVRYVCIVRHALDAVVSMSELIAVGDRWPAELHRYVVRHPRPLEALAHAWADGTDALLQLAQRRPEAACVVRYEDLVARPRDTMAVVMAHVGETWPHGLESRALAAEACAGLGDWKVHEKRAIDEASIGRRRTLSRHTVEELAPIVNATLERCGYAPIPTGGRPSRVQAFRLLETALKLGAAGARGVP